MTDADHRPGFVRRHRPALAVGAVVAGVAAIIAFTVVVSGDDTEPPARPPAASPTTSVPLSGAAAELVGLLDEGTKQAFDGRYTVSSNSGPGGTLRLWSRPPLLRVDTELGSGTDLRRTAQFSLPSGTVSCSRQAEVWSCRSQPLPIGLGLLPEGFADQLARYSVEARSERVGTHDARCFTISGAEGPDTEVCLTPDGVPVRLRAPGGTAVELAEVDRSPPPAEIFEPPAPLS